ncbi:MAG: hypothetical protein Q8K87_13135 [Hydrogenophaga sp.]|nr:hypothetical protein [Hydrogenophaga sp.]MDP1895064.1 hypothetical protein [Hydrogenophaga sp.]
MNVHHGSKSTQDRSMVYFLLAVPIQVILVIRLDLNICQVPPVYIHATPWTTCSTKPATVGRSDVIGGNRSKDAYTQQPRRSIDMNTCHKSQTDKISERIIFLQKKGVVDVVSSLFAHEFFKNLQLLQRGT